MISLLKKEINTFFSQASGSIILLLFLLANGIILWIMPGDLNVLESGFAQMDALFILSPILFIIFIPALTMRLFSDEFKEGTIEIIMTKPLSNLEIVIAKYLSGLILLTLALIPTLIYYYSISELSEIKGNVDSGGIAGSYIGLFLLASSMVAIGTFASSISKNQIVSFIIAIITSAFFYQGWELMATSFFNGKTELAINYLSMNNHYLSISKGVIDSRDIIYFISLNIIFILLTKNTIAKRK